MSDFNAKDYIDAKLAVSDAQMSAKFSEVMAELRIIDQKVSAAPSSWTIWGAVGTGAAAVLGVLLAVLSFGGDRFDGGVQLTASSISYLQETKAITQENSDQIKTLSTAISKRDNQIDTLIDALSKSKTTP